MTEYEIISAIDDGAIFYLRFFGDAEHMATTDNGVYSVISPKESEHGIRFVYDIRLEQLSDEEAQSKINEIKALSLPTWWPLYPLNSPRITRLIYGADYTQKPPTDCDEFNMAVVSENQPDEITTDTAIKQIDSADDFMIWAELSNRIFANGYQDIHQVNHYHWARKGLLIPYIAYCESKPVAVASILNNKGIASLEFVAALPDYRRRGFAKAISAKAVHDAFEGGAIIITARAFSPAHLIYQALGFQIYPC